MSNHESELLLRVNGIEFGFPSQRVDEGRGDPYRQANASYSLVQRREGQVVRHTLIDVGMGACPFALSYADWSSHSIPLLTMQILHPPQTRCRCLASRLQITHFHDRPGRFPIWGPWAVPQT